MNKNIIILLLCITTISYHSIAKENTGSDRIVATYQGGEIKESQLINEINTSLQDTSPLKNKKFSDLPLETQKSIIEGYVNETLLEKESLSQNIDKSDKFQKKLEKTKKQMIIQEYLNQYIEKNVTKELIDEEYKTMVQQLTGTKERKVSHILVKSEDTARDVKKQLDSGKAKFAALAKKYSIDESTKNTGGLLGFIRKGVTIPEFELIVFNTQVGKFSSPFNTVHGWHIVHVMEERDVVIPSKEQAKPENTRNIQQNLLNKLISDLYKKSNVKILPN